MLLEAAVCALDSMPVDVSTTYSCPCAVQAKHTHINDNIAQQCSQVSAQCKITTAAAITTSYCEMKSQKSF
jgi:hypothetical protein